MITAKIDVTKIERDRLYKGKKGDLEKEIQKVDPFAWFHKSCIPLSQVDFTKPHEPDLFERACSSGGCFT